jgi:phosphatidylinositol-3-phosphatase
MNSPTFRGRANALTIACCALLVGVAVGGCGGTHPGAPLAIGAVSRLPHSARSHVVEIVMENAGYEEVIGSSHAPYVNALARRYGLATSSFAVTHPSLPNYLALTSGSTHGISSDCSDCSAGGPNIVDELEAAHVSWAAYLEEVPRSCYTGAGAGGYAKKHNPFAYYPDVVHAPSRCAKLVGFARLAADLRAGSLPTYVWITPNLCDDGHDCGVAGADRFLSRALPALLRELGPHGLLVLSWDEGDGEAGCCGLARGGGRIATLLAGPEVRRGARTAQPLDHYGVLATIEEALGLPLLAAAADPRSGRLSSLLARPPAAAASARRSG